MTHHISTLIGMAAAMSVLSAGHAEVYRVVAEGSPGGDGLSWATAFDDLHAALAAAGPGDEVWVASGTYVPSTTDSTVSFVVPSGIGLYGGFAGTETARSQRDPDANVTVLSGDVDGDDNFIGSQWALVFGDHGNSGHVLDATGVDASTVIDGFTVSQGWIGPAGTGATNPLLWGSGLYMPSGSATVRNCRFWSNRAAFGPGAGAYVYGGNPVFENCRFEYNSNHIADGGGLFTGGNGSPIVRDTLFAYNTITFDNIDNAGGGWYNDSTGVALVERCRFISNSVIPFYIYDGVGYGGGFFSFSGGCDVRDCEFIDNRASIGGGMITWAGSTITNSLFAGNWAPEQPGSGGIDQGGVGGGLAAFSFAAISVVTTNCTITANRTDGEGGGAVGIGNGLLDLRNCIIYGNTTTHPEFAGYSRAEVAGFFDLTRCDVHGIFGPPAVGEDLPDPGAYPTEIDADPLFVDPAGGDYRLSAGSPVIDAGYNDLVPAWATTDLDGNQRLADDPATPDTGIGNPPVDLGAYEFGSAAPCPADLAEPFGVLDLADIGAFVSGFTAQDPIADINSDGVFDLVDINLFITSFLAGCP